VVKRKRRLSESQRRLVEQHYDLARWIAWRHCKRIHTAVHLEFDCYLGPAEEALCKAALTWGGDGSFAGYCDRAIRRAIYDEVATMMSAGYVPRRTREKVLTIKQVFGCNRFPDMRTVKRMFGYTKFTERGYRRLYMAWLLVCSPQRL